MKRKLYLKLVFLSIILFIVIQLFYYFTNYFQLKGFNPSDDGVILAQSWRILNGQIPHIDFISIRPALSGYIHTLNFLNLIPLELSARVFTSIEYFTYSFFWSSILYSIFKSSITKKLLPSIFIITLAITYFLNQNFLVIWPWTTIDAILLSTISLFLYLRYLSCTSNSRKRYINLIFVFIFASLAVLARQTFAIYVIILSSLVLWQAFKDSNKIRYVLYIVIIGNLPIIIYLSYYLFNSSASILIDQIFNKSGILEPVIKHPVVNLFTSITIFFFLGIVVLFFVFRGKTGKVSFSSFTSFLTFDVFRKTRSTIIIKLSVLIFIASVLFYLFLFLFYDKYFLRSSYAIFWLFTFLTLFNYLLHNISTQNFIVLFLGIVIGWVSAISYGLPSPIFFTGSYLAGIVILTLPILKRTFNFNIKFSHVPYSLFISLIYFSFLALTILYIKLSLQRNYRDVSPPLLKYSISSFVSGMDGIRLNSNFFEYYSELKKILNELNNWKDNVVFLPGNSILYPLLKTKNPFPLDWLQVAEYKGSEEKLEKDIEKTIRKKKVYLILDKFNSNALFQGYYSMDYETEQYITWFNILKDKFIKLKIVSKYFYVYKN